jgi:hypothetical protein
VLRTAVSCFFGITKPASQPKTDDLRGANSENCDFCPMPPDLLPLNSIREVLEWYEHNLCRPRLHDPRGCRVRFRPETLVHLVQLKTKYRAEPKNKRLALEQIRSGRIQFVAGRFDAQRTQELSWACHIATNPDFICQNWQVLGSGGEAYVKNFGSLREPQFRVMICEVVGMLREVVTVFPRERIGPKELVAQIWP